jgi:hypothetical protein
MRWRGGRLQTGPLASIPPTGPARSSLAQGPVLVPAPPGGGGRCPGPKLPDEARDTRARGSSHPVHVRFCPHTWRPLRLPAVGLLIGWVQMGLMGWVFKWVHSGWVEMG